MADDYVSIVFVQGDDYRDMLNHSGYDIDSPWDDIDACARYLSAWDYGDESDHDAMAQPWGSSDRTADATIDGMDYVLSWNDDMEYAALQRHPLGIQY